MDFLVELKSTQSTIYRVPATGVTSKRMMMSGYFGKSLSTRNQLRSTFLSHFCVFERRHHHTTSHLPIHLQLTRRDNERFSRLKSAVPSPSSQGADLRPSSRGLAAGSPSSQEGPMMAAPSDPIRATNGPHHLKTSNSWTKNQSQKRFRRSRSQPRFKSRLVLWRHQKKDQNRQRNSDLSRVMAS